jgi:hypothetical protein
MKEMSGFQAKELICRHLQVSPEIASNLPIPHFPSQVNSAIFAWTLALS